MTSLNDGPVRANSAPGKPLIVLTGAAHLMVRGAHACVCELARPHLTRILDGRVRALECSGENMPRKLGAHSGHES